MKIIAIFSGRKQKRCNAGKEGREGNGRGEMRRR